MKKSSPAKNTKPFDFPSPYAWAVLVVIGLTVYASAVFHPFLHDDIVFIQQNPDIADFKGVVSVFSARTQSPSAGPLINVYYRPLLEVLYRAQYQVFGLNPHGYHLTNILLHIANALLVMHVLGRVTARRGFAWLAALLFLLHPVQSEAVACIAGISNLFFTFFFLLSINFYLENFRDAPGTRRQVFLTSAALAAYAIALLAKEQAAVLPLVLILHESCRAKTRRELVKRIQSGLWLGILVLTLAYFLGRHFYLGGTLSVLLDHPYELMLRMFSVARMILMYLGLIVWPLGLHYYRSLNVLDPPGISWVLLTLLLGGYGYIIYWMKMKRIRPQGRGVPETWRLLVFGAGWFGVTLLPMLNIIPLINEYSLVAVFEHFLYLPIVGVILSGLLLGEFIFLRLFRKRAAQISLLVFSVLLLLCAGATIRQNTYWRGEVPLFKRALQFEQGFGRLHILMGRAYRNQGEYESAVSQFLTAQKIMEAYRSKTAGKPVERVYREFIADIHRELAKTYERQQLWETAIAHYEEVLRFAPSDDALHNNIGINYIQLNRYPQAAAHFHHALSINSRDYRAMSNLAVCYIKEGKKQDAEALLRRVLSIKPGFVPASENLKRLLRDQIKP